MSKRELIGFVFFLIPVNSDDGMLKVSSVKDGKLLRQESTWFNLQDFTTGIREVHKVERDYSKVKKFNLLDEHNGFMKESVSRCTFD
jgi:hypothetical protein